MKIPENTKHIINLFGNGDLLNCGKPGKLCLEIYGRSSMKIL